MFQVKRVGRTAFGLLLGLFCALNGSPITAMAGGNVPPQPDQFGGWSSERIVVQFHESAIQRNVFGPAARGRNRLSRDRVRVSPALAAETAAWQARGIRRAYPFEFGDPELARRLGLDRFYLVDVPRGSDTPVMARAFARLGREVQSATVDVVGGLAETIPNDPHFPMQWGMRNTGQSGPAGPGTPDADIDATEAWDIHTGLTGAVITIAFLDSGVDAGHDDLRGRILPGFNSNDPSTPDDTFDHVGHGSHVTGIATANSNNATGVAGVTWGANILPVRVVDDGGFGTAIDAAVGLVWAVDHGADICNMSLQYCSDQSAEALQMLRSSVQYAKAKGVLVVAAAGNRRCEGGVPGVVAFPGKYPETIAVSATTKDDLRWTSSSTGPEVELSAPGELVWSTHRNNGYAYLSGTSMATPHVSGLAALVWSYAPYLSDDQLRSLLTSTADDLGEGGRDQQFGFGRINAFRALSSVPPPISIVGSFPPDGSIDARQPSEPNGSNPDGWKVINLFFDANATGLGIEDFEISLDPPGVPPALESLSVAGATVIVRLVDPIPPGHWTVFTHVGTGTSVRIGNLPGDVNGSGTANVRDITSLVDSLNQVGAALNIWSVDVDRTGLTNAADITRLIDLLQGNGVFDPYQGMTLPR